MFEPFCVYDYLLGLNALRSKKRGFASFENASRFQN